MVLKQLKWRNDAFCVTQRQENLNCIQMRKQLEAIWEYIAFSAYASCQRVFSFTAFRPETCKIPFSWRSCFELKSIHLCISLDAVRMRAQSAPAVPNETHIQNSGVWEKCAVHRTSTRTSSNLSSTCVYVFAIACQRKSKTHAFC
jgi:hypothetical protein